MAQILIIDDDAAIRTVLSRMLKSKDHTTLEASDGRVGIRHFEQHRPALVITDIIMPDQEGVQTILELRKIAPLAKIIAISGSIPAQGLDYLDMARRLGADAVLRKPIRASALIDAVERLLAPEAES